jgi:phosphopantetheinyl transferase
VALFYQHNINEHFKLATWRIEEPEAFFTQHVPVKQDVTHPYKRLQHLAGRFLLRELYEDFPLEEILIADTKKPFLKNEKYHFSISHSGYFAAAIASPVHRVGVDVELVTPRIANITQRFLNEEEHNFLDSYKEMEHIYFDLATILWSAKEAVFKWYGDGQVDFRQHMQLQLPIFFEPSEWMTLPFLFRKGIGRPLVVHARLFESHALAYVVS